MYLSKLLNYTHVASCKQPQVHVASCKQWPQVHVASCKWPQLHVATATVCELLMMLSTPTSKQATVLAYLPTLPGFDPFFSDPGNQRETPGNFHAGDLGNFLPEM